MGRAQATVFRFEAAMLVVLRLAVPVLAFGTLFLVPVLLYPEPAQYRAAWFFMIALFTTPLGKFVAIGMLREGFGVLPTTFLLGSIEICFALFFTLNFDLLYRVPRLGPWVRRVEAKSAAKLAAKPAVRRFAFLGIVLWTFVPFQGTGAITGAVLGRLVGMGRAKAVGAVAVGSYLGILAVTVTTIGLGFAYRAGLDWGLYSTLVLVTVVYILWAGFWSPYRPPAPPETSDSV